ncbi:TIGR03089 family protein [Corynebacterium crudilactis]|uniref:TIGR03089 family protein n=1 Tax=Corynebacterium crudilactis TaxID=1652495 RepID=A0A172QRR7_9CORY|nr:TIGR03089 family protein [Corynebacterium crudilactis]ANE03393.1 TIGR03089 family protein [Corynebacterium crudilactis]
MELLSHLFALDPATPRLTVYNETTGARLDFSAITLDNWASKVGNMLLDELDLEEGSTIAVDLPVSWQASVIVLGALAAGVEVEFTNGITTEADAVFTSLDRYKSYEEHSDVLLVSEDPFGRGIVESGGDLPQGAIDFGPTVRFYGDQFFNPTRALPEIVTSSAIPAGARILATGWSDFEGFKQQVLEPLSVGGSAVIVAGLTDQERLEHIAANEKVTHRI